MPHLKSPYHPDTPVTEIVNGRVRLTTMQDLDKLMLSHGWKTSLIILAFEKLREHFLSNGGLEFDVDNDEKFLRLLSNLNFTAPPTPKPKPTRKKTQVS